MIESVHPLKAKLCLRNARNRCDHKEADARLLLHARHACTAHDRVIIRSPDTDVFILMLAHINQH